MHSNRRKGITMGIRQVFERDNHRLLRILFFLVCVCVLFNIVYATQSVQAETGKHFLWSIQTAKNTVYLLGSVHFLRSDAYPLADTIERAYDDSQKIMFEADLDAMKDPALQTKMMTLGLYLDGQTLRQNIPEETYKVLEEKVVAAGLPMAQFDHFRPWFAAVTLTVIELEKLRFDPSYGVDAYFFGKAKKDGKQRIFLERAEYQLDLFAKMSKRDQESFLKQTLEDLKVLETMASDMVNAWQTGNADTLDAIMNMGFKEHPDIYDRMIVQRNKKWVAQIEDLMNQEENVLVIVGAGHLVGNQSVLQLLKQRGRKIEQR
jgi:uncharacterized protein YbaP (TraB family)